MHTRTGRIFLGTSHSHTDFTSHTSHSHTDFTSHHSIVHPHTFILNHSSIHSEASPAPFIGIRHHLSARTSHLDPITHISYFVPPFSRTHAERSSPLNFLSLLSLPRFLDIFHPTSSSSSTVSWRYRHPHIWNT